jgi:hypothetical protein
LGGSLIGAFGFFPDGVFIIPIILTKRNRDNACMRLLYPDTYS